jgi:hypothetical protein
MHDLFEVSESVQAAACHINFKRYRSFHKEILRVLRYQPDRVEAANPPYYSRARRLMEDQLSEFMIDDMKLQARSAEIAEEEQMSYDAYDDELRKAGFAPRSKPASRPSTAPRNPSTRSRSSATSALARPPLQNTFFSLTDSHIYVPSVFEQPAGPAHPPNLVQASGPAQPPYLEQPAGPAHPPNLVQTSGSAQPLYHDPPPGPAHSLNHVQPSGPAHASSPVQLPSPVQTLRSVELPSPIQPSGPTQTHPLIPISPHSNASPLDVFDKSSEHCLDGRIISFKHITFGGNADIHEGFLGDRKVAIKTIRPFSSRGTIERDRLLQVSKL